MILTRGDAARAADQNGGSQPLLVEKDPSGAQRRAIAARPCWLKERGRLLVLPGKTRHLTSGIIGQKPCLAADHRCAGKLRLTISRNSSRHG